MEKKQTRLNKLSKTIAIICNAWGTEEIIDSLQWRLVGDGKQN